MALSKTSLSFVATFLESSAEDLGTAVKPHTFRFPGSLNPSGDYDTGTTDNKFDIIWSDSRALAATTEDLDVRGVLT
ncbi:MAG: hypothetical protein Q8S13_12585, partial [Dehalococcoidia bacterium]|nr:hypothetical protein [Dehalococcoidia bacterium]